MERMGHGGPRILARLAGGLLPGLAGLVVAGCEGETTGPGGEPPLPAAIEIGAEGVVVLVVGDTVTLQATVRDGRGVPIPDAPVSWSTRDATVASVSPQGVVRGTGAGETWVVASVGALADSVPVEVRFAPALGEFPVRVRGAVEETWSGWKGGAILLELLGTDRKVTVMAAGSSVDLMAGELPDTGLFVAVPREVEEGSTALGSWDPAAYSGNPAEAQVPMAYLLIPESETRFKAFANRPGGTLTVEEVVPPPGPGFQVGTIRGRVAFQGDGYTVEIAPDGAATVTPTGETASVVGGFHLRYFHFALPRVEVEIVGGPYPGSMAGEEGGAFLVADGVVGVFEGRLGGLRPQVLAWLRNPAPGPFTVPAPDRALEEDPASWPDAFVRVDFRDGTGLEGVSVGGSGTVDRYTPPVSDSILGSLQMRVQARMVTLEAGVPGDSFHLSLSMAVPVLASPPVGVGPPEGAGGPRAAPWLRGPVRPWLRDEGGRPGRSSRGDGGEGSLSRLRGAVGHPFQEHGGRGPTRGRGTAGAGARAP